MYHPAAGVKIDRNGKKHLNRSWGFYQSTMPDYHVRWHRDINAALNMLKLFRKLYHDGDVPEAFLRATPREQLTRPEALRYRYKWLELAKRHSRWTASEE